MTGIAVWHRHRPKQTAITLAGVEHVGLYDLCRCGAARMEGDRRWWCRHARTLRSLR